MAAGGWARAVVAAADDDDVAVGAQLAREVGACGARDVVLFSPARRTLLDEAARGGGEGAMARGSEGGVASPGKKCCQEASIKGAVVGCGKRSQERDCRHMLSEIPIPPLPNRQRRGEKSRTS